MAETNLTILDTQLVQFTLVACATLLIYDFLCTLDQEVKYVWQTPWSPGKVLFFLNRYLPFIDTFLSLHLKLSVSSPEKCRAHFTVVAWFIVIGIIISEIVLLLRTYALWERKRSILIILCVSGAVTYIPAVVITNLELRSLKYVPTTRPGCQVGTASSIIIFAYILLMLSETVIVVLTVIRARQYLRHSTSPWVIQLYQDGMLFYAYLLSISIANILVPILAPRIFANWLASPQRVLHSVLCNRVLLLILRQRSSANMTARIRVRGDEANQSAIFTSFIDDEVSANLTFTTPTVGSMAVSSTYVATSSNAATLSQSLQVQSPDTSYVDV